MCVYSFLPHATDPCIICPAPKTLNLAHNRIKDVGVEEMSCATLGQEYDHPKARLGQAWHQQQQREPITARFSVTSTEEVETKTAHLSGEAHIMDPEQTSVESPPALSSSDLPLAKGSPLFAAAIAPLMGKHDATASPEIPSASVLLEGNRVSDNVVARQGALAGVGEAALFRGCVLPETVATNQALTRSAFWNT